MSSDKFGTNWLTLEHGKAAYRADFLVYGITISILAVFLAITAPSDAWQKILVLVLLGLAGWTFVEYVLHRFVLHGLQPFKRWHLEHHRRPAALICTPTILSSSLIALLVFLPSLLLSDLWSASALTLGLLIGYMGYAVVHHAIHHWHGKNAWLKQLKRWHGMHHHSSEFVGYGVTSAFWDHALGTAHAKPRCLNLGIRSLTSKLRKSSIPSIVALSGKARIMATEKSELE